MNDHRNAPDPEGLAIAREIQEKVHPAEIILGGSRAIGEHRPDSDVDLTAVAPDDDSAERAKETLRELLEGKRDAPVVNVTTITREEFQRLAPMGQSFPGQAARYGVTPEGRSLNYLPEREPTPEEVRELTIFWLRLADNHMTFVQFLLEERELCHVECLGRDAQWGLERAFKGLLAAGNDPVRFRRDAAEPDGTSKESSPSRTVKKSGPWRTCWPPPPGRTGPNAVSPPSLRHSAETPRTPA